MNNLKEKIYDIKDLYIVKLNENYTERKKENYIQYYNKDLKFIVEKFSISKDSGLPYYIEYYTECITEQDLVSRQDNKPFTSIPIVFSEVNEFPLEYLTLEEKNTGKITTMRLFQIFQEINIKNKTLKK